MANEVRSQRLMQFLGVTSNPALAPFAKFNYIIREIAKSLDLDPDKVTNNMDEAAIQAEIMKNFAPEQPPQAAGAPTPPGTNPMDTAEQEEEQLEQDKYQHPVSKGSQDHNKELLQKLKPLVSNNRQWQHFSNYLDMLLEREMKVLEQSNDMIAYTERKVLLQLTELKD